MTIPVLLASLILFSVPKENAILEFTASWCQPCQRMSPIVSRLQREGFPIQTVDVEHQPRLSRRFKVKNIPTFILLVNGKEAKRIEGATTASSLRRLGMQVRQTISKKPDRSTAKSGHRNTSFPKQSNSRSTIAKAESSIQSLFQIPFFRRTPQQNSPPKTQLPVVRAKYDTSTSKRRIQSIPNFPTDPLASCTRIRVKDGNSINFGSGTIIDSQSDRSLIVTCGHIFRKLGQTATIEVDVFTSGRTQTFLGQIVRYDLEADVGLIAIPTTEPLSVCQVALLNPGVAQGLHVLSVGCNGGETPTKQQHRVTAVNRYQGPDNVECTGVPVQGRSGGGLFNTSGQLVGVCIAADPRDRRGLYAGLKPIHQLLNQCGLACVLRHKETQGLVNASRPDSDRQRSLQTKFSHDISTVEQPMSSTIFASQEQVSIANSEADHSPNSRDVESISTALKRAGKAEVVCIIRPLDSPESPSRIVIINRASAKFIADLTGEMEAQSELTSVERKSRTVVIPVSASRTDPVNLTSPLQYRRSSTLR